MYLGAWTLTKRLKNKLRAVEMGCLQKILGVSRISHIRNTDIKNQLNIQHAIVDRIRSRRLRYFGHVVRMQHRSYVVKENISATFFIFHITTS